ncbi:MAG TPA: carbohydrate kinase family protein [Methanomicrobiales archaeon]|nr:carbohydrate kinase family protein [Methanomicrobiales archaeon]
MIHVVGHTAIDHILRVPRFPERNCSTFVSDHQVFFGGGAANIAAGIARLGAPVTLVSAVGEDFAGSEYEGWLRDLGVATRFFVVPGKHTPTAFVFTDEKGDQITYFEWGASGTFARQEAPALDLVHLATADPDFNVRVAEKGRSVSFDPGQDIIWYSADQVRRILARIRILFANRHEMEHLTRILEMEREAIIARVPVVVVTMDTEGSVLYTGGREHRIPVVPVKAVDPTGAGDAYRAGFLAATHRGHSPLTACRVGATTASFVVEKAGCQTNLPDWSRMAARYWTHFGDLPLPNGGE